MRARVVWLSALAVALGNPCEAQDTRHSIVATVHVDDLNPGGGGVGGAVQWLRVRERDAVALGISLFQVEGMGWVAGTVTGSRRLSTRLSLHGSAAFGMGERPGQRYFYRRAAASATVVALPGRIFPELSVQYLSINPIEAAIVGPAVSVQWSHHFATRFAYGEGVAGNYRPRYGSVGVTLVTDRVRWLAGGTLGSASLDMLVLQDPTAQVAAQRDWYIGIAVPVRHTEFSLVFSRVDGDTSARNTLAVVSKVPIS